MIIRPIKLQLLLLEQYPVLLQTGWKQESQNLQSTEVGDDRVVDLKRKLVQENWYLQSLCLIPEKFQNYISSKKKTKT